MTERGSDDTWRFSDHSFKPPMPSPPAPTRDYSGGFYGHSGPGHRDPGPYLAHPRTTPHAQTFGEPPRSPYQTQDSANQSGPRQVWPQAPTYGAAFGLPPQAGGHSQQGSRRTIAIALAAVTAAIGILVCLAIIVPSVIGHRHVTTPDKAAGMTNVSDRYRPALTAMQKPLARYGSAAVAAYAADLDTAPFLVGGMDNPSHALTSKETTEFLSGIQRGTGNADNASLGKLQEYGTGPHGGKVWCAPGSVTASARPVTLCAWLDVDTMGVVLSTTAKPPDDLAGLTKRLLAEVEN